MKATYRKLSITTSLIATAVLPVLAGCGAYDTAVESEQGVTATQELNQPSGWNKWPTSTVPVCWKASTYTDASYATFRDNVRRWTLESISRVANLQFVGWGQCPTTANNQLNVWVDTSYDNSGNGPGGAGWQGTGAPTLLQLGKDALDASTGSGIVVHEFMHRIGFGHEFNRTENKTAHDCNWQAEEPGNTYGTSYDHDSIMNDSYCGKWNDLSPWDIVGLQNAYGRHPAGTLLSVGSRCLDIPMPFSGAGATLQTYHCNGGTNQQWRRDTSNHLYAPTYTNSYLDVRGGPIVANGVVEAWYPNSPVTENQQWAFNNVEIKAIGGKCVDVPSGNFADQQRIQIYGCHGGENQKWTVSADGVISHGNFCWDIPNGATTSGTAVQLYTCHGGSNQRFTFTSKGEIKFGSKCVDVVGGAPNDQSLMQLYSCKSDTSTSRQNQRYYLSGPVEIGSGYCLDIPSGDINDNVPSQIYPCNGGANQKWDFYFGL